MNIREKINASRGRLVAAGIENGEAGRDANLLARHILGWDRATVYTRETEEANAAFIERFDTLTERRARREPVAYIRGEQEFWSRDFAVNSAVLIPRPETELVIEELLECFPADLPHRPCHILECGKFLEHDGPTRPLAARRTEPTRRPGSRENSCIRPGAFLPKDTGRSSVDR